jgi:hypothetical protein
MLRKIFAKSLQAAPSRQSDFPIFQPKFRNPTELTHDILFSSDLGLRRDYQ